MPITDQSLFKGRVDIVSEMLTALESAVPDVYLGDDGVVKILFQIEAAQLESVFLANQLLLEDVFPQTASSAALKLHGDTFNVAFKLGDYAQGAVIFSGSGGTVIDMFSEVGADMGSVLDALTFTVDEQITIPDPGDPIPPTVAVSGVAGVLDGTYEYRISFLTAMGETEVGDISSPVQPTNQQVNLSVIPIGGSGTTGRRIYRRKNGIDPFKLVTTISDNTTTVYTDNVAEGSLTTQPVATDTAHRVTADVTAREVGTAGNVVPGAISLLIDVPAGVTGVTNPAAFSGGENPETTEEFRARLLEFLRNPRTGATVDLEFWAETVRGVEEATVFNNDNLGVATNGHATVRISGPGGAIPDADTIAEVQALLDTKDLANITIHVTTFTQVSLNVTVNVTEAATHTLGDVTPSVQQAIQEYILSVPVGGTVYLSGIVDAVFGLSGVQDVVVTSPASNQTATATQKFVPGTVTVT
jgi:uncharacterized phage protein gp47/JayE